MVSYLGSRQDLNIPTYLRIQMSKNVKIMLDYILNFILKLLRPRVPNLITDTSTSWFVVKTIT